MPDGPWPRVARLDARAAVAEINRRTGAGLSFDGMLPGGQVGAARVRRPDGRRAVLTTVPGARLAELERRQFDVMRVLRGRGYPAPDVELAVETDTGVVIVQQLLPGTPLTSVDEPMLAAVLALNDLQAGALADRPDIDPVRLFLTEDGPGFCQHEPLRRFSADGARLEAWVRSVGVNLGADVLPGADAVHVDFQPSNVLTHADRVTGVVDWDGAGRGDRALDLITLRFGMQDVAVTTPARDRLDGLIAALPARRRRPAWAHLALRMADWAVRHFDAGEAERWIAFGMSGARATAQ